MNIIIPDDRINELINEKKSLPKGYLRKLKPILKPGHYERTLDIVGDNSSEFQIRIRRSHKNPLNFSATLLYKVPKTYVFFRLRRYNGRSHNHTNSIEGNSFFDYHIHKATERYQILGIEEDSFAEPTDQYADLSEAVDCLIKDCGFYYPYSQQTSFLPGFIV